MNNIWNLENGNCFKTTYPDWFGESYRMLQPEDRHYNKVNIFPMTNNYESENSFKEQIQLLSVKKVKVQTGCKTRTIFIPDEPTKRFYRLLLPELYATFRKIAVKDIAHGFLPGASCVSQAKKHIGYKFTISMDIKDFFDSIRKKHIEKYIESEILDYLLIDGAPRQGLPTSPILSNIALNAVDDQIFIFLKSLGFDHDSSLFGKDNSFIYTRYADDLSISIDDPKFINQIISATRYILRHHGFKLNEGKTKILNSTNGRRIICGVGVGENGVYITRRTKKKIRAARHQKNYSSLIGLYSWMSSIKKRR